MIYGLPRRCAPRNDETFPVIMDCFATLEMTRHCEEPEGRRGNPFYTVHMDDKEYYTLMNRSSSWALQQALKKKNSTKKTPPAHNAVDGVHTYSTLEARQGRADAEMLLEKQ